MARKRQYKYDNLVPIEKQKEDGHFKSTMYHNNANTGLVKDHINITLVKLYVTMIIPHCCPDLAAIWVLSPSSAGSGISTVKQVSNLRSRTRTMVLGIIII